MKTSAKSRLAVMAIISSMVLTMGLSAQKRMFISKGGPMIVFPSDSLDISALTYIVDGKEVSQETFCSVSPDNIYSLTIYREPGNTIVLETKESALKPSEPACLPDEITYKIDGKTVSKERFSSIHADSISKIEVTKGEAGTINICTVKK